MQISGFFDTGNKLCTIIIVGKPQWPQIRVENEVKVNIKLKMVCTEHQFGNKQKKLD
jgi:hypothetical protein